MKPNAALIELLREAYSPCPAFQRACSGMMWNPTAGHVPRGFTGAFGEISEVQLVLVFAEPGDPHSVESYSSGSTADDYFEATARYTYSALKEGKDLFHRNIRYLLDGCWPGLSLAEQLTRTWITDSVLCSAAKEGGYVPARVASECRSRYLEAQLELFPNATVVAVGGKAQQRLKGWPGLVPAIAVAPPGCNDPEARKSWDRVAQIVRGLDSPPELARPSQAKTTRRRKIMAGRGSDDQWRQLKVDGFARSNSDQVKSAIRYSSQLKKPGTQQPACGFGFTPPNGEAYVFLHNHGSVNLKGKLEKAGFQVVIPGNQSDRWLRIPGAEPKDVDELTRVLLAAARERYQI